MASKTSHGEFAVSSGVHTGATFALTEDMLLIGGDESCDIRLSDAGIAARHAAVMADGRGVAIRALDGQVSVDGQRLEGATRRALAPGSEIALGQSAVRLRFGGLPEAAVSHTTQSAQKPRQKRHQKPLRTRAITASMLLVAGVLALAFAAYQLRPASAATPKPAHVSADPGDKELIDQLRDVFRANGYDAEITRIEAKRLRIENLDSRNQRVRRAADQARADIPQLTALTFVSPDSDEPPAEPPFYENEPAGHLTVRVDGETAYLAAPNGARYFKGSVLPGGYIIRRITSRGVQVDRDGQISWFRF